MNYSQQSWDSLNFIDNQTPQLGLGGNHFPEPFRHGRERTNIFGVEQVDEKGSSVMILNKGGFSRSPAMQWGDQYLKRQCGPATMKAAGLDAHRIRPLGLTVAGFSAEAYGLVLAAIWATVRARRPDADSQMTQALHYAKLWIGLPPPRSALARPNDVKHHGIVFQPRLWDTTPGSYSVFDVANVERRMPREFISADGFHITPACRKYLSPLVKGEDYPAYRDGLPAYVRLRNVAVPRKLPGGFKP